MNEKFLDNIDDLIEMKFGQVVQVDEYSSREAGMMCTLCSSTGIF